VRSGAHATRVIFLSSGSGAAHFINGKDSGDNLNTRLYKQHFGHNWKILKSHPKCTRQPWTEEGDALSVKFVVAICLCSVDQRFKRCSIGELGDELLCQLAKRCLRTSIANSSSLLGSRRSPNRASNLLGASRLRSVSDSDPTSLAFQVVDRRPNLIHHNRRDDERLCQPKRWYSHCCETKPACWM